jgi:hypothetical protein
MTESMLVAYNPTPYPATRVIRCGGNRELTCTVDRHSEHIFKNVVRVNLTPNGFTEVDLPGAEALPSKIKFTPSVQDTLGAKFNPGLLIDGRFYGFTNHSLWGPNGYTVLEARLIANVGKDERFIARRFTYVYDDCDVIDIYLHIVYENLNSAGVEHTVVFKDDSYNTVHKIYGSNGNALWSGKIYDGQAISAEGVIGCYSHSFADQARISTLLQAINSPLLYDVTWERWGPLSQSTSLWDRQPKEIEKALVHKSLLNYSGYQDYLGYVSLPDPSTTGAQPEFGIVSSVESLLTDRRVRRPVLQSYFDRELARQECLRPNKFCQYNGDFVTQFSNPNCVPWDEEPHYNLTVSPDQLNRRGWSENGVDGMPEPYDPGYEDWNDSWKLAYSGELPWQGHDREHYSCKRLVDNILRFDDPIAKCELEAKAHLLMMGMTLPSEKPGWSTNDRGTGRGQGRTYKAAAYMALGLGLDSQAAQRLLAHMYQRMVQCTLANWTSKDKDRLSCRVERVIEKDRRVFNGVKPGWIVWEDALFVEGCYVFMQVARQAGIHSTPEQDQEIWDMIYAVGKAVTYSGFVKRNTIEGAETFQIAKYVWYELDSDGNFPYLAEELKYDKAHFVPADETDFKLWALNCLACVHEMAIWDSHEALTAKTANMIEAIEREYSHRRFELIRFGLGDVEG